ncbi:adenylate/guanylate cyclase domain-containing protein [Bradyrhizobium sp. CCBAU 53421]|uniref:adenylate/guanylate cyclase domain-containing protein n=1 Tax=Bradyrhizobium sp. CCBAU 53421 TaxID=1325120 RepID=UPI001FEEC7AC|nr:adenylate/guanylate cyclase domain-containing protein [Bradyrhizobium sp. CCBAU 53421]
MAADVVGYSALMERAEEATYTKIGRLRREVIEPSFGCHGGRLIKTTGDGILAEFASPLSAVKCGLEIQEHLASHESTLQLRIGINLGDVIVDEQGDVYGEGINIAARLESVADPGGILISGKVHSEVEGKLDIGFEDRGEQQLKNITKPVRAYAVSAEAHSTSTERPSAAPPLPHKPSIAVLPFQNMSGDPEQEYFADGIAEDVLTTLSKIQELLVIARNSSFVFKGQVRDIREIGRMLGARYVLEGSVRKAGNRVRLAAQLIDSLNGGHVWADRFEGDLDDVFELQDRITQDIVAALEVRLTFGEEVRVWRKRSGSPLVYEHFLKGRTLYVNFAKHTHAQARSELERALEINPAFTPALGLLGFTLTDQARFGWEKDEATTYEAALGCAARALAVDPNSDEAYVTLGYTRLYQRRHDDAVAAGEKAIALCPNSAGSYHMAAVFHSYAGDFRKAVQYEEQAQRLSPLSRHESMVDAARGKFHLGDLVAARDIASRVLSEKPRWLTVQSVLVAALWNLGNEDEARVMVRKMLVNHPNLTASRWAQRLPYRHQKDLDAFVTPLRLAGLPE